MYYKFFCLKQQGVEPQFLGKYDDIQILFSCSPQYSKAFKKYLIQHKNEFQNLFSYLNQTLTFNNTVYCQNLIVLENQTKFTPGITQLLTEILTNLLLVARAPVDNELEEIEKTFRELERNSHPNLIGFHLPESPPKITIEEIDGTVVIYLLKKYLQKTILDGQNKQNEIDKINEITRLMQEVKKIEAEITASKKRGKNTRSSK